MSFMAAKAYLEQAGFGDRVMEFDQSSATVEEAAATALYASRFRRLSSILTFTKPVLMYRKW